MNVLIFLKFNDPFACGRGGGGCLFLQATHLQARCLRLIDPVSIFNLVQSALIS